MNPSTLEPSPRSWTSTDVLVFTAAFIWGTNYSIIKLVLQKLTPTAFVAIRLSMAAVAFLIAIAVSHWLRARATTLRARIVDLTPGGPRSLAILRTSRLSARDWLQLTLLGVVGHFLYQTCFIEGLSRTSVANASLIIGCTPIAVALISALRGSERLGVMHWVGAAISLAGIYLVVGTGSDGGSSDARAGVGQASLAGDLLIFLGVACWTAYTIAGRHLLMRHSPLVVTGYSMAIGAACFLVYSAATLTETDWTQLHGADWLGVSYSSLLGLNVSYVLWYAGVQKLGSSRTSLYTNLVPIVSMALAAIWLGEHMGPVTLTGAAAVLGGLALTRVRLPLRAV